MGPSTSSRASPLRPPPHLRGPPPPGGDGRLLRLLDARARRHLADRPHLRRLAPAAPPDGRRRPRPHPGRGGGAGGAGVMPLANAASRPLLAAVTGAAPLASSLPAPDAVCKQFASKPLVYYQLPVQALDFLSGPPRIRTADPLIKSQLLYQLS